MTLVYFKLEIRQLFSAGFHRIVFVR